MAKTQSSNYTLSRLYPALMHRTTCDRYNT